MLLNLVLLCAAGYAQAGLVTYSNGAVVPVDYANQAATAAHLASKFAYGYSGLHYLGKREAEADAEADAGLVGYPNGAVVPYNPYLHGFAGHYGHYLGKRDAEADAGLVGYPNGAVVPYNPYLHGFAGHYGHYLGKREADAGLVGYTNGAVVPYNPYLHGFGGHYGHYLGKREAEADAGLLSYAAVLPYHAVYQPLVAHPNGAVVPLEPAAVVAARADHLATKYGK